MSQTQGFKSMLRHRLVARGESVLLPLGAALAVVMLLALGASAWWTIRVQEHLLNTARRDQIAAAGELLAGAAESMLAADQLTPLRRLLAETARRHELHSCSVVLPDGRVIADADPSRITAATLAVVSQTMPSTTIADTNADIDANADTDADAADDPWTSENDGLLVFNYPLSRPGGGSATLQLSMQARRHIPLPWQAQAGMGAISASGLALLLLVYRRMRRRVLGLSMISHALLALEHGEKSEAALAVSDDFGPEAGAFNHLLEERRQMRAQMLMSHAGDAHDAAGHHGGDLVQICDSLRHGMVLVDHELKVAYANGAGAVFLRCKRDEIVGREMEGLLGAGAAMDAIRGAVEGPSRRRQTVEMDRGGDEGDGLLRFSVRPIDRDDKPAAVLVIEDVTQQRVAEEARSEFVAHATHELRMPLTNIRLYLETALDEGEKNPKIRGECLNVINQESMRLERLVGDMLSMNEMEAGSHRIARDDVRLDALFGELEADYQAQARDKKIALTFNLPPKLPVIQADRDKLVLALHNLIGNALKYTLDSGSVTVTVEAEAGRLVVEVNDTGIGISEEDQAKIFDKFYRARDSRVTAVTGSGLGLALAREIVRLHGGDVSVKSELNQGSTFTMIVPIREGVRHEARGGQKEPEVRSQKVEKAEKVKKVRNVKKVEKADEGGGT